jgi:hypothetical protein
MTPLPLLSLAFVSAARLPADFQLPKTVLHLYYESRIADVVDEHPKYSGPWSSQLAVLKMIMRARLGRTGCN